MEVKEDKEVQEVKDVTYSGAGRKQEVFQQMSLSPLSSFTSLPPSERGHSFSPFNRSFLKRSSSSGVFDCLTISLDTIPVGTAMMV